MRYMMQNIFYFSGKVFSVKHFKATIFVASDSKSVPPGYQSLASDTLILSRNDKKCPLALPPSSN